MKLDTFYLIVDSAEWIARLVPLGRETELSQTYK